MLNQPLKLTAVLLFAATALAAQKGALGIQAGAFASTLKLAEVHYDISWQQGFAGGVFYRIPLHDNLSLQPEANFVRRRLRGTYSWDTYNALDPHVVLDYAADQNIWELGAILHQEFGAKFHRFVLNAGIARSLRV